MKKKRFLEQVSSLPNSPLLLVEFQAFDSYKNRVGHFKLQEYVVFQLINKVPPAPTVHWATTTTVP
jgi:hypothetical protein